VPHQLSLIAAFEVIAVTNVAQTLLSVLVRLGRIAKIASQSSRAQETNTMSRRRSDGYVMISVIAERYNIHPQTLRLYEREGLIKPARTQGNTRLYGEDEIRKLEMILALTRDLGVNLAGVEVILNMQRAIEDAREAIDRVEDQFDSMMRVIRQSVLDKRHGIDRENALVKVAPRVLTRVK
jgi:MerR family transcriptional regulator/heat shock protein HspR